MVAPMVAAALCVLPAILINVDWSSATPLAWKVAPVGLILGAALFAEAARRAASWAVSPAFVALALLLMAVNTMTAFTNATHRTEGKRDDRSATIAAAEKQRSQWSQQWSQWSQGRAGAVKLAGETPAASIRADVEALIASDARRWQSTGKCDPLLTTAPASMSFCRQVASLRSRLAAAEQRDKFDALLAQLAKAPATTAAPATADPFGENLGAVLGALGIHLSDDGKRMLSTQRDILLAVALELLATFGPAAAFLIFGHGKPAPSSPTSARPAASAAAAVVAATPDTTPDVFAAFCASRLEQVEDASIRAGDAWEAWLQWCSEQGIEPGTQKRFGSRMKLAFTHDRASNRPRYLGVRLKRHAPQLKVVAA